MDKLKSELNFMLFFKKYSPMDDGEVVGNTLFFLIRGNFSLKYEFFPR